MCQHCMGANQVSRRATKLMPEIREMPYPQGLRKLKLVDSLQCMALKLEEGRYTCGHCLKLKKRFCRTALRQHAFSQQVVDFWNRLPEAVFIWHPRQTHSIIGWPDTGKTTKIYTTTETIKKIYYCLTNLYPALT